MYPYFVLVLFKEEVQLVDVGVVVIGDIVDALGRLVVLVSVEPGEDKLREAGHLAIVFYREVFVVLAV